MATSIPNLEKFCDHLAHERRVSDYTVRNYRAAVENFVRNLNAVSYTHLTLPTICSV